MSRKQLLLLLFGILVPWTLVNGLVPLLPIYALGLGASEAIAGYYLAFSFLALAVGSVCAGWLADKFQRRKVLLIVSASIIIPSLWLNGQVQNIWQLVGASIVVWFSIGMASTTITILAGLFAGKNKRGRVLGLIGMTAGIGAIIGGLSVGPIVDRWGYPAMFTALSLFTAVLVILAIFIEDKKVEQTPAKGSSAISKKQSFGKYFYLLLLAQMIVVMISPMASMGRSLSMNNLGYAATAVTSTVVISGFVSLPFPFVLGWLSDRLGRKHMMAICYASFAVCIIVLAVSTSLWHFWIVFVFWRAGMASRSVGAAFAADLVDPRALGRGVALLQSIGWLAFAIGFAISGSAFQAFGIAKISFVSTALPVIGIILIMLIRVRKQKEEVAK